MAYNLGNKCAKNCCKRTCLVQLIVEDVVTCFLRHNVLTYYLLSPHGVQIHSTDAAAGASVDRWRSSAALLLEAETPPHYCKHFGGPKNQSFGNNSGKPTTNPDQIRCTCTDQQATTFSKFGCDRLSGGTTGTWTRSTKPEFFCRQNEAIFRQLPNGRLSPNLAVTRKSMSPRNVLERISKTFCLWIICSKNLQIDGGRTDTLLRPACTRDALQIVFTRRCSARVTEFLRSLVNFFVRRMYALGAKFKFLQFSYFCLA